MKWNILFFTFELVIRKQKNKSLTIEKGTSYKVEMKLNIFQLRVSNSKVKQGKFNLRAKLEEKFFIFWHRDSNWKCNFVFFDFELVTRSATFYFSVSIEKLKVNFFYFFIYHLRVRNSKCNFLFFNFELVLEV